MGAAFKPVLEEDLSPEMEDFIAKLKAAKEDPNLKLINPDDFNWAKSREMLKHIKGNFSDLVWEDREGL